MAACRLAGSPYGTGAQPQFSVGEAFSWGWKKFTENWAAFVGALAVFLVVGAIIYGIFYFVISAFGLLGNSAASGIECDQITGECTVTGGSGGLLAAGMSGCCW